MYLIEHVFPKDFFTHKLEGLSVDIAVFRDLIAFYLPELSGHLEMICEAASKSMQTVTTNSFSSGGDAEDPADSSTVLYEPPLTNLFTMQWFLMHAICHCVATGHSPSCVGCHPPGGLRSGLLCCTGGVEAVSKVRDT